MIKDKLKNAENYYNISENLKQGFEWLKSQDLKKLESKQYIIDGDNLYANLQEYKTKTDALYEAHKNYIDIQYMIEGIEKIGVCNRKECTPEIPYDSSKDIEFMKCNINEEYQTLKEGDFCVFFPNDAHKPSICINKQSIVKKIVVKVLINIK